MSRTQQQVQAFATALLMPATPPARRAHPPWHPDGAVKLSDFGLGALPNPGGQADLLRTTCGTPNYVAPEASRVVSPLVLSSLAPGPRSRLDAQAWR